MKEKQQLRKNEYANFSTDAISTAKLDTKFMKKTLKQDKLSKSERERSKQELAEKRHKMQNYAKIVKEMHWPDVSPNKQREMQMLIKQAEKKKKQVEVTYGKPRSTRGDPINDYMYSGRSKRMSEKASTFVASDADTERNHSEYTTKKKNINWKKFKNPMVPKPKLKRKGQFVDYLLKKRIQRQEREQDNEDLGMKKQRPSMLWQNVNPSDLTDPDK